MEGPQPPRKLKLNPKLVNADRFLGGLVLPDVDWEQETEPFTLLPSQRPDRESCGCKKLLAAVLADAFQSLTRPPPGLSHRFEKTRRETLQWFSKPDAAVKVSLRAVCDGLGLDVGKVQAAASRVAAGAMSLSNGPQDGKLVWERQ